MEEKKTEVTMTMSQTAAVVPKETPASVPESFAQTEAVAQMETPTSAPEPVVQTTEAVVQNVQKMLNTLSAASNGTPEKKEAVEVAVPEAIVDMSPLKLEAVEPKSLLDLSEGVKKLEGELTQFGAQCSDPSMVESMRAQLKCFKMAVVQMRQSKAGVAAKCPEKVAEASSFGGSTGKLQLSYGNAGKLNLSYQENLVGGASTRKVCGCFSFL